MRLCNVVGKMKVRVERFDVGPCSLFMEKSPSTFYDAPSPEVSNGETDRPPEATDRCTGAVEAQRKAHTPTQGGSGKGLQR